LYGMISSPVISILPYLSGNPGRMPANAHIAMGFYPDRVVLITCRWRDRNQSHRLNNTYAREGTLHPSTTFTFTPRPVSSHIPGYPISSHGYRYRYENYY